MFCANWQTAAVWHNLAKPVGLHESAKKEHFGFGLGSRRANYRSRSDVDGFSAISDRQEPSRNPCSAELALLDSVRPIAACRITGQNA